MIVFGVSRDKMRSLSAYSDTECINSSAVFHSVDNDR